MTLHVQVMSNDFKDALKLLTSLVTTTTDILFTAKKVKLEKVEEETPAKDKAKVKGKKGKSLDDVKAEDPKTKTAFKGNGALYLEIAESGTYVKVTVPAQVLAEGTLCANAEYLKGLKFGNTVEMKQDKNRVKFLSGSAAGVFEVQQDVTKQEAQRPLQTFTPKVSIPPALITRLVERTSMVPTMQNDTMPLRVFVKSGKIVAYCSEAYRACHFEAECASSKDFDALLSPEVLQVLAGHVRGVALMGVKEGIFQMRTSTLLCYSPTIQKDDIDDIDERINVIRKGVAKKKDGFVPKAKFSVSASALAKALNNASSINVGALTPSVQIVCDIGPTEVKMSVIAAHGKMHDSLAITGGPKKNIKVGLSSKYMTEMLALMGASNIEMSVFSDFVTMVTANGEATMVLATADL